MQEALTNVVKHARAARASIRVSAREHTISVEVSDDGIGFDPKVRAPGFGLIGMRERLELVGGRLEISSGVGRGTTLQAELPIENAPRSVS